MLQRRGRFSSFRILSPHAKPALFGSSGGSVSKKPKHLNTKAHTLVYTKVMHMDPERVRSIPREYRRTVHITVRVSPDVMNWLRQKRFSPSAIFNEAIKELGYRGRNWKGGE